MTRSLHPDQLAAMLRRNPDLSVVDDDSPPPKRAQRATFHSEHALQVAVIATCNIRAATDPRYGLIFAIPNGGQRNKAVAAKLKAEGVRAGVPDLFLPVPCGGHHGLFIELKVGKNKPTDNQTAWIVALLDAGYYAEVVHDSVDAVMDVIESYLEETP